MKRVIFCAAVAVGMGVVALAVEGAPRKGIRQITEPKVMARADGSVFRYRWHEPAEVKPGEKYPLVVFLHGAAATVWTDLVAGRSFALTGVTVEDNRICFAFTP